MQINFLWAHSGQAIEKLHYGIHETIGGEALIAASDHGLTAVELDLKGKLEPALKKLAKKWPKAQIIENSSLTESYATLIKADKVAKKCESEETLNLHIYGTSFQQVVWQELIEIPFGQKVSYQSIAENIGNPEAAQAIGNAVGANPIALIVPCHRVVRTDGELGGYRWGLKLKEHILALETGTVDQIEE